MALGVAWITTDASCLPMNPVFKVVTVEVVVLAAVTLLGGMVSQKVASPVPLPR